MSYVVHKGCVRRASADRQKQRKLAGRRVWRTGRELIVSGGQRRMGCGSQLYPIALTALIFHGRNSKKISFSGMVLCS